MTAPADLAPIDPLVASLDGVYRDALVEVRAGGPPLRSPTVRTAGFDLRTGGPRVVLSHRVPPERLDDDLAGALRDQLFAPGWLRGGELFERVFTGVVLSSLPDPLAAWERFYRNTVTRIAAEERPQPGSAHGTIADYAPVHAHAAELVVDGSVLELGSCFGFLALRLAAAGHHTTASDINAGTMRLLATVAPRLGVSLDVLLTDAARIDAPDDVADTVVAVHLLEHLDPHHGALVLAEAVRLARRRVVVAVPLEDDADETWGHVRTVTLDDLRTWGARTGLAYEVHERHGGWLVLDLPGG